MLEITTRCNKKCPICEVIPDHRALNSDICDDLAAEILRVLSHEGIETLSITGGEPTIPWDLLLHILSYAKAYGLSSRIYTNGSTLNKEKISTLSRYLTSAVVTLDSLDTHIVEEIRGTSDDLSAVLDNIRLLSQSPIETIVISVCSRPNYTSLQDLTRFLSEVDIDGWWIQQFIPVGRGRDKLKEFWIDNDIFLQTVVALKGLLPGRVRSFPFSGEDRKRVFVNYQGNFVDYQSGKILGSVLDDMTRNKILNSKEYLNKRRGS